MFLFKSTANCTPTRGTAQWCKRKKKILGPQGNMENKAIKIKINCASH